MNTSFWSLGWRTLWRDLRAGELRLLMVAVTLAVAALTSVGFFSDRLQGGLQRDARTVDLNCAQVLVKGKSDFVHLHAVFPSVTCASAKGIEGWRFPLISVHGRESQRPAARPWPGWQREAAGGQNAPVPCGD